MYLPELPGKSDLSSDDNGHVELASVLCPEDDVDLVFDAHWLLYTDRASIPNANRCRDDYDGNPALDTHLIADETDLWACRNPRPGLIAGTLAHELATNAVSRRIFMPTAWAWATLSRR